MKKKELKEATEQIEESIVELEAPPERAVSGSSTAKRAGKFLESLNKGFKIPTPKQRQNLLIQFARRGYVIYGRAFDIVKIDESVNLSDEKSIEQNFDRITIYEIKSTKKLNVGADFERYFFSISTAELLVAQSLKERFKFVFVNINTGTYKEMTLRQIYGKAKNIYPTWSIMF